MIKRWTDVDKQNYMSRYDGHQHKIEKDLLLQAYSTTLLGAENDLTMHGGGNTSVKKNIAHEGRAKRALYVKASGTPLNSFTPEHFVVMDLEFLESLKDRGSLDDETMAREFRNHQLINCDKLPSIESLMHAFIPAKFVAHTHPSAILKIANRIGGGELLKKCFGADIAVVQYAKMGYDLAKTVSDAVKQSPGSIGVVMRHHGLIVWGEDAREVYEKTIDIVTKAEKFLEKILVRPIASAKQEMSTSKSIQNFKTVVPMVMESFLKIAQDNGDKKFSAEKISLTLLNTADVLELIGSPEGKDIICNPPMTPDYPMHVWILPLWTDACLEGSFEKISTLIGNDIGEYASNHKKYLKAHDVTDFSTPDLLPRAVVHPQIGAICFCLSDKNAYKIADFTRQAFSIRRAIAETGGVYESLPEKYLLDMQYRGYMQGVRHVC
ncbi:MAG: class II aldolase/adducin family protein [Chitinispirillales bacterium]|jgi:rhamnose utilization protein RhaD (predicted bifunctional aldolase and dehydrogenase)|nr:class II aldolase/adducin family protein [Chitinispirillales bacterium]